jgi:hypothetical protein
VFSDHPVANSLQASTERPQKKSKPLKIFGPSTFSIATVCSQLRTPVRKFVEQISDSTSMSRGGENKDWYPTLTNGSRINSTMASRLGIRKAKKARWGMVWIYLIVRQHRGFADIIPAV